eukprot:4028901-Lingulodinium_polyedra.AAC.1
MERDEELPKWSSGSSALHGGWTRPRLRLSGPLWSQSARSGPARLSYAGGATPWQPWRATPGLWPEGGQRP